MAPPESPPRRRRRLAAILMADVVGFSRMMSRDEEGTTSRIVEFHDGVRSAVERHGGRVVGTAGDSVFGDFDSILDALECAAAIQRALWGENVGRSADDRIETRIGLHLGDVIVEGTDVFGDGVNVAARIEQLADPGGIMLSAAAYHLVRGRTDLPIERVGTRTLKNIAEPVELYRIPPETFVAEGQAPAARSRTAPAVPSAVDPKQRIRDAVDRIVERAAEGAERVADRTGVDDLVVDASDGAGSTTIVAPIRAGSLALITTGVLGILGWTSGWTDNGWYPFLGCWSLGIGLGGPVGRLSGVAGMALLLNGAAVAVGALFFDNVVMRAALWVVAAGILGAAIHDFGRRNSPSPRR